MTRKLPILLLILIIAACSINEQQPHTEDATTIPQPPIPANAPSLRSQPQAKPRQSLAGSIPLTTGWNLISIPELPNDTDPAAVLASIDGSYERVLAYDNCDSADPWKEYDPDGTSDLTAIDHHSGFWVEMTQNDNLNYDGTAQTGVAIALCQGWNLIGYPLDTAYAAADILAPIRGKYTLLYAHELTDTSDPWAIHSPTIQRWAEPLEDLTLMQPGRGYWLYATENTTLVVDVPTPPTPTPEPTDTPVPQPTPTPDPADTTPPTVSIDTPTEDAELFAPTDIVGTVSDPGLAQWTLEYAPIDESFVVFKTGYGEVLGGVLGQLDTTLQVNGFGRIRLTATDGSGNSASITRNVVLSGDNKPGIFTLTLTDLAVDLAGIPISVNRTYDSRLRQRSNDFGFGWSLSIGEGASYRNNRPTGDGWTFGTASPFGCNNVQETTSHFSEIRFRANEFYRFAVIVQAGGYFSGGCVGNVAFTQVGGVPGATLEVIGNDQVYWQDGSAELLDFNTFALYQPNNVRLTLQDGRVYHLTLNGGITHLGDVYGNSVTIGRNAITHSSGVAITMQRDASGRITAIQDPSGATLTYLYDGAGDLVQLIDRAENTTTYHYDDHLLTTIDDPLGHTPLRNVYDEQGRLIGQYDADGNFVEITTNLAENTMEMTDPHGIPTRYEYDERGNVTAIVRGDARFEMTYDANNNRTSATDPLGNRRTFAYNADGLPTGETNARGAQYNYQYDGELLTQITDPDGGLSTVQYDGNGDLTTLGDADGITIQSMAYDANGNLATVETLGVRYGYRYDVRGNRIGITDTNGLQVANLFDDSGRLLTRTVTRTVDGVPLSEQTTYQYDPNGRPIAISDADGLTRTLAYNPRGQVVTMTDERNTTTRYTYDARGLMTRKTYCDGTFEAFGYDQLGRQTAHTDRAKRTTFYAYNGQDQLIYTIFPDGAGRFYTYDLAGRLVRETDERGFDTVYQLNADGPRTAVTTPLGHTTVMTYSTFNRPITIRDPLGNVTQHVYEHTLFAVQRPSATIYPDGTQTSQSWGLNGRVVSQRDEFGRTTQFSYDLVGNLIGVIDPLNQQTTYAYDEVGNRIAQTDRRGNTTQLAYDSAGRIIRRTLPQGQSESFTYDGGGNLLSHTDFNGATTTYTYNCLGQRVSKQLPDGTTVTYAYDDAGNLTALTDTTGTTTYTYDRRDRITSVTFPNGVTLSYGYDDAGNRTRLVAPNGITRYAYDADNRLIRVTAPDGGETQYSYDAAGNRSAVIAPSGVQTTYEYDMRHRLTAIEVRDSADLLLTRYDYELDAASRRTRLTESNGRVVNYTYDELSRLIQSEETLAGFTRSVAYTYDAVGNRTSVTTQQQTQTFLFDANNRMMAQLAADTFTYDDNGNLRSHTRDGQTTTYEYDAHNRLVRVVDPLGNVTLNRYNDHGLRVSQAVNGAVTQYVWDIADRSGLPQIVAELDDTGALIASYTYGDDRIALTWAEQTYFYHYDGMGSTRLLTDSAETIVNTYRYDDWGNLLNSTGDVPNPFQYTGQQFDPNSGFYYLRARHYAPQHARFISHDPYAGSLYDPLSLHKYQYSHNNPISNYDPTGLYSLTYSLAGLTVRVTLQQTHVLAIMAAVGYQVLNTGSYTSPSTLGVRLQERLQTARLNETLTLADLRSAAGSRDSGGGGLSGDDANVGLDAKYGRGAIAAVYLTAHALMGAGTSDSFVDPFTDGAQAWIANLPEVDGKPGHYINCGFNEWAYQVVKLNLINYPFFIRGTLRKLTGVQLAISGLGSVMAFTVGDSVSSIPPTGPADGICHGVGQ